MEPILDTRGREPTAPLPSTADVVVIGGGVTGCATAYQLAKRGVNVVLIEAGAISSGASGRNGGFVAYGMVNPAAPGMHAWTSLNRDILRQLDADWNRCFDYRENGSLRLALNAEELESARQRGEELAVEGVETRLVSAEEAHRLCPVLSDHIVGALYNPRTAQITPYKLVFAYRDRATALGANIFEATAAAGFVVRDGRLEGVETTRGTIRCRWAVIATNGWASQLGAMAGLWLAVRPTRGQIMVTEPLDVDIGVNLTGHTGEYWRQTVSGQIVGGGGRRLDPRYFTYEYATQSVVIDAFRSTMAGYMPVIAKLKPVKVWSGIMGYTLDNAPLVGEVSSPRGLIVAAGFSGNGNPFGSAVGHCLAEYIATGQSPVDMSSVHPQRFATPWRPTPTRGHGNRETG